MKKILINITIIFTSVFIFSKPLKIIKKNGKLKIEGYEDIDIIDDDKLKMNNYTITVRNKKIKKDGRIENKLKNFFLEANNSFKANDIIPEGSFRADSSLKEVFTNNQFSSFGNQNSNFVKIKTNVVTNLNKSFMYFFQTNNIKLNSKKIFNRSHECNIYYQ